MAIKYVQREVKLRGVRLSFPHLFEPTAFEGDKNPKYQATFLMQKGSEDHLAVAQAIKECIAEKWGKAPAGLTHCLRDGSEKDHDGYGPDVVFVCAKKETKPSAYNSRGEPVTERDGVIYAGCWVRANITIYATDNNFGKKVSASLSGVRFLRDDAAFGGGRAAGPDDFAMDGGGLDDRDPLLD